MIGTFIGGCIAWILTRIIGGTRHRRAARELLVPHGGFVCLKCHYPLTGNAYEGICPECGTPYRRDHTVWVWREYSGLKDELPEPSHSERDNAA